MALTQVSQLIGKTLKSPIGKAGMVIAAGLTAASIFSSCKKEVFVTNESDVDMPMDSVHLSQSTESLENCVEGTAQQIYGRYLSDIDACARRYMQTNGYLGSYAFHSESIRTFFENNPDKLSNFANWCYEKNLHHHQINPKIKLKVEDYTPTRAAYFVLSNSNTDEWCNNTPEFDSVYQNYNDYINARCEEFEEYNGTVLSQGSGYKYRKEFLYEHPDKLAEFKEWHNKNFPAGRLRSEDYTPERSSWLMSKEIIFFDWWQKNHGN